MKPSLLILIALASIAALPLQAQRNPTFARLWPGNFVEILDLEHHRWRRVHQSPAWSTTNPSVSRTPICWDAAVVTKP